MKLLAVLLILAVIIAIAYVIYVGFGRWRSSEHGEWKLVERPIYDRPYQIYGAHGFFLVKPGEKEIVAGEPLPYNLSSAEFQEEIIGRRVAAQDQADVLNRRLTA